MINLILNILIVFGLIALGVSNYILLTRKRSNYANEELFAIDLSLKDLKKEFLISQAESEKRIGSLVKILDVQSKVIGTIGSRQIIENRENLKRVDLLQKQNNANFARIDQHLENSIENLDTTIRTKIESTRNRLEKLIFENRSEIKNLSTLQAKLNELLAQTIENQREEIGSIRTLLERKLDDIQIDNESLNTIQEKLNTNQEGLRSDQDKLRLKQRGLGADQENLQLLLDQSIDIIESKLEEQAKNIVDSSEEYSRSNDICISKLSVIDSDIASVRKNEESFSKHVKRQNLITKSIENLVNRSNAFNYNTFQVFNRRFLRGDYEESLKPLLDKFELDLGFNTVGYLAHKICKIEEDCIGRLATNIQDALIRVISVFGIAKTEFKILEIGTLFGINLCIVEELGRAFGKEIKYQVIDPLDGYYKSGELDIVTKQQVNSKNFWYNIKKCALDEEKFELIKGFSHHKKVINRISENSISLIFVDGDHTKKGVNLDIRNYYRSIHKGGYFIFDDYGSTQWPEVKEAVDSSRIIKSNFEFVGHAFRTAIYRKK